MGISGLLPLLKSIQVNKHLSEFSGQTLAVDAYVWLHRGVYSCATELATGKRTTKYIDYAMHRVRLLRHHKIEPYVVFDGGPLPAKKGTEKERKQKREENLARGHALEAQGKHSQARDFYVKCVDVTPQMAYQLIKVLRAESVPYVVAPYEADAQLAYLERIGVVDGIITEDSDLLVFGCRNVLFKLDSVTSTLDSVSRSDFASVDMSDNGVSFLGWSDVEFRAMAILSGCDYLPSIPGVGLKTAWSLLRKHKTAENVVRFILLEGKKDVPKGYMKSFKLAEKCFIYQRVYDPVSERLVHLTEKPDGEAWDEETEAYIGSDIEPLLAKKVARGDADPVTLLPMEDINPNHAPRALKNLPSNWLHANTSKGKEKATQPGKSHSEGILGFFTRKSQLSCAPKSSSQPTSSVRTISVGRECGKRTLVDVMDNDLVARKKKRERDLSPQESMQSRFFGSWPSKRPPSLVEEVSCIAGPSRSQGKENTPIEISDDEDVDLDISMEVALEVEERPDLVTQEDGYISPSSACARNDTPDLSSPIRPPRSKVKQEKEDFQILSSPPVSRVSARSRRRCTSLTPRARVKERDIHPVGDASSLPDLDNDRNRHGPDLKDVFADEQLSDIDCFADDINQDSGSTTAESSFPQTPVDNSQVATGMTETSPLALETPEEREARASFTRNEAVANGWWEKWARQGTRLQPVLRRRETTVGSSALHEQSHSYPRMNRTPKPSVAKPPLTSLSRSKPFPKTRKSLIFSQS